MTEPREDVNPAEPAAQQPLSRGDELRQALGAALSQVFEAQDALCGWHAKGVTLSDAAWVLIEPLIATRDARVRAQVAEDLRRTLAALNVALYWARPDTPEGRDEIAGCRVALEMGQAALERLRAPSVRPEDSTAGDSGTPAPQRFWWYHDGCNSGPTPGPADWPGRSCGGCGMSLGGWTRGAPITEHPEPQEER